MHLLGGCEVMTLGRQHGAEFFALHPRLDELGARGLLEGRHDGARNELEIAGMTGVERGENSLHFGGRLALRVAYPSLTDCFVAESLSAAKRHSSPLL
jgi:hypothetical protein